MSRTLALVLVAVGIFAGIFAVGLSRPADAAPIPHQLPNPCDLAPIPILESACELANPATAVSAAAGIANDATGGVVPQFAGGLYDQGLQWLAGTLSDTVKSAFDELGQAMSNVPEAPVGTPSFKDTYGQLMPLGAALCFIVFFLHVVFNMLRRVGSGLTFGHFVFAVFLTAAAPMLVKAALTFADALTSAFASVGGQQAGELIDKVSEVSGTITATGGLEAAKPVVLVLTLIIAVLLALFWMLLLTLRGEVIYIGTLAAPFIIPSVVDGKARFAKWYAAAMFGVIMAKPVLFGVVCAGAVLLRDGYVGKGGLHALFAGIGIVLVATFGPFIVIKTLIPAMAPVIHAAERAGGRVVDVARSGAHKATLLAAGAISGGAAAGAVGMASPTASAPPPRPAVTTTWWSPSGGVTTTSWAKAGPPLPTDPHPPPDDPSTWVTPPSTPTTNGFPWTTTSSSNGTHHESEPEPSRST